MKRGYFVLVFLLVLAMVFYSEPLANSEVVPLGPGIFGCEIYYFMQPTQCDDGRDNDGDGLIDLDDPGCANKKDETEDSENKEAGCSSRNILSRQQCCNARDDDFDGKTDFPSDKGCESYSDNSEDSDEEDYWENRPQCDDGIDNDLDGLEDYGMEGDPDCDSFEDDSEFPDDSTTTLPTDGRDGSQPAGRAICHDTSYNRVYSNYDEITEEFYYEGVKINWELRVVNGKASVAIPRVASPGVYTDLVPVLEENMPSSRCGFYKFGFAREPQTLTYVFDRETLEPNENGECRYLSPSYFGADLRTIGGANLDGLCWDLINGIDVELENGKCPLTQDCNVVIEAGESVQYGVTLENDLCGYSIIMSANGGQPLEGGEAEEFISACSAIYS